MAASRDDIRSWFDRGVDQKATHLIVVCDTYDHDDYPVYVISGDDAREKYKEYSGKNMQRVMEVYDLSKPRDEQMNQHRAFNF